MEFKDMKFGEILALKYNFDFEVINDALSLQISNDRYKNMKLGEILKEQNKIEDDLINEVLKIQEKEIPTTIFNQNVTSNELLVTKEIETIENINDIHFTNGIGLHADTHSTNGRETYNKDIDTLYQNEATTQSEQVKLVRKEDINSSNEVILQDEFNLEEKNIINNIHSSNGVGLHNDIYSTNRIGLHENNNINSLINEKEEIIENICLNNADKKHCNEEENIWKDVKIGEILNKKFGITRSIIDEGLSKQVKIFSHPNKKKLGTILVDDGLVSRDLVSHAYALQKNVKYLNYNRIKQRIDFKIYKDEKIYKAFNNDSYIPLLYTIRKAKAVPMYWEVNEKTKKTVLVMGITELAASETHILIDTIIRHMASQDIEVDVCLTSDKLFSDFELKYKELTLEELENFSKRIDDIKAEEFLKYLLVYSILHGVSDIHISPSSNDFARIAVRVFGDVETLFYIPSSEYNKLVSVIKTNADMKAEKTQVPQDGRIDGKKLLKNVVIEVNRTKDVKNDYDINENKLEYNFEHVSFRVSSYPTESPTELAVSQSFEKIVIRVLNLSSGLVELSELGLNNQITTELDYAKTRNQGIIFIVGPTGSGKSTTIYSALSSLNAIKKNIISFEDPVEMRQLYWSQGQRNVVKDNENMNFDYLQSKKSILRQDPDIILMGEVRDEDSASFAIEAANTGHLVFTTLHSNSAAAAFERIKKLGVMPLEIASATLCVLSQRLVKEVCSYCKIKRPINEFEINTLKRLEYSKETPKEVIETNKDGCLYCNHRGYIGRSTLAEIIPINSKIKEAIVNEKPDYEIRRIASENGYKTILEDGIERMNEGKVSLEDILKII